MTPDFFLCDICGGRASKESRIFVPTANDPCPSGTGCNETGEYIDLCEKHLSDAVVTLLRRENNHRVFDYDRGQALLVWAKSAMSRAEKKERIVFRPRQGFVDTKDAGGHPQWINGRPVYPPADGAFEGILEEKANG